MGRQSTPELKSEGKTLEREQSNQSAITDHVHVARENHVIDWYNIKVLYIGRVKTKPEVLGSPICIKKRTTSNEQRLGGHRLSHLYNIVLAIVTPCDKVKKH